jgi:hypothetical protein
MLISKAPSSAPPAGPLPPISELPKLPFVPLVPGKPWMLPHKPLAGLKPWPFMLKPHPKLFPFPCPLPWKGWKSHGLPFAGIAPLGGPLPFVKPVPFAAPFPHGFGKKPFFPLIGGGFSLPVGPVGFAPYGPLAWKKEHIKKFLHKGALGYGARPYPDILAAKAQLLSGPIAPYGAIPLSPLAVKGSLLGSALAAKGSLIAGTTGQMGGVAAASAAV